MNAAITFIESTTTMAHVVQLGANSTQPFPLIVTATRNPKNDGGNPIVECFRVEEMSWTHPVGAALRNDQQTEFDVRYGEPGKEPGVKPSAEDVALFIVASPVPITDSAQEIKSDIEKAIPAACGALRNLGDGYFELKRMYAVPKARGTGAALSILASLEYYARGLGSYGLRLETGSMQEDAKRFYRKHGYKEIPLFGNYKDAKFSNCYEKSFISLRTPLVPPQLPPFLSSIFNLKPILGHPNREEIKLVHEAVRALNNFMHTPELRDTDLSTELSQHLFDIQMSFDPLACHRQKYPVNVLPNEVIYEPPSLPDYIPIELKSVTGSPSNKEVASVHTAFRISESFANVPSLFDSDLHAQLSQHLFDIQLARHVQRSILNQFTSATLGNRPQTIPQSDVGDTNIGPKIHDSMNAIPHEYSEPTAARNPLSVQPDIPNAATGHQHPDEINGAFRLSGLMVEIRDIKDTLKQLNQIMIGSQNSLAIHAPSQR
ncbi:unnamed protein product [Rhizoctonia solani]|uniref:N-acetyltransferase domain-containing protein n=1 Tax=Rhizoctonia solani TaxID=456999 RepID=A0A8H3ADR1_9AGAM|nr:unnamed protein product [Rhizoctonia solani]